MKNLIKKILHARELGSESDFSSIHFFCSIFSIVAMYMIRITSIPFLTFLLSFLATGNQQATEHPLEMCVCAVVSSFNQHRHVCIICMHSFQFSQSFFFYYYYFAFQFFGGTFFRTFSPHTHTHLHTNYTYGSHNINISCGVYQKKKEEKRNQKLKIESTDWNEIESNLFTIMMYKCINCIKCNLLFRLCGIRLAH